MQYRERTKPFKTIGPIVDTLAEGYDTLLDFACDFHRGYDFSEDEVVEQNITYAQYVQTYQGIDMYYDYAGDYYFFTISE